MDELKSGTGCDRELRVDERGARRGSVCVDHSKRWCVDIARCEFETLVTCSLSFPMWSNSFFCLFSGKSPWRHM